MTYHDQPYYKEFRNLLGRIQSAVHDLRKENQRLKKEHKMLSDQLKEVRGMLDGAQNEVNRLRNEPSQKDGNSRNSGSVHDRPDSGAPADLSPRTLFDSLDENEKRILRQQIIDMISRIDKHLNQHGTSLSTRS